jgi:chromosome segregation ATPase
LSSRPQYSSYNLLLQPFALAQWQDVQQVCDCAGTVRDLQQRLSAAQKQAEDAQAAVAKSEADLEDLSGAYNTLEAHAFKLEGQLREQQQTGTHLAVAWWSSKLDPRVD